MFLLSPPHTYSVRFLLSLSHAKIFELSLGVKIFEFPFLLFTRPDLISRCHLISSWDWDNQNIIRCVSAMYHHHLFLLLLFDKILGNVTLVWFQFVWQDTGVLISSCVWKEKIFYSLKIFLVSLPGFIESEFNINPGWDGGWELRNRTMQNHAITWIWTIHLLIKSHFMRVETDTRKLLWSLSWDFLSIVQKNLKIDWNQTREIMKYFVVVDRV